MRRGIIKILTCFALFLSIVSLMSFTSLAASNETAVRKQVTKYLKGIQKCDYKVIEKVMTSKAKSKLVRHEQPIEKVIRKMQKKWFSYTIKNVTVSGKKATVTVRVKYYDAYLQYDSAFYQLLKEVRRNFPLQPSQIYRTWAKYLLKFYSDYMSDKPLRSDYAIEEDLEPGETSAYEDAYNIWATCFKTKTVKIPLVKEKGTWKIADNTKTMQDMTDCRINSSHKQILKHEKEYKRYFIFGF